MSWIWFKGIRIGKNKDTEELVRIKALADMFPRGNIAVDVGCDHGYLGIELLSQEKAEAVINIDISKSAIKRAEETYKRYGYFHKARFLASDGLSEVRNIEENVVIIIAGLGSQQIINIMNKAPESARRLLLLSHTDYYLIRDWCSRNHYQILKEKYVSDKKFVYLILDIVKVNFTVALSLQDKIFGERMHWEHQLDVFASYWKDRAKRLLKIPFEYRSDQDNFTLKFLLSNELIREQIIY